METKPPTSISTVLLSFFTKTATRIPQQEWIWIWVWHGVTWFDSYTLWHRLKPTQLVAWLRGSSISNDLDLSSHFSQIVGGWKPNRSYWLKMLCLSCPFIDRSLSVGSIPHSSPVLPISADEICHVLGQSQSIFNFDPPQSLHTHLLHNVII